MVVLADVGGHEVDPAGGQDAVGRADGPLLTVDEVDAGARRVDGARRGRRGRRTRPATAWASASASGAGPDPGSSRCVGDVPGESFFGDSCLPGAFGLALLFFFGLAFADLLALLLGGLVRELVALLDRRPLARGGVAAERRQREQDREPAHA